jgi:peptidyl-prolyl cis-trans isomerase SurA
MRQGIQVGGVLRLLRLMRLPGLLGLLLLPAAVAGAQDLLDGIVAIVDKNPVFASDVERAIAEDLYVRRLRGEALPADSAALAALRGEMLESLIDRRLVIAKAKKDGIEVTATEVEDGLDQWLSDLVRSSGSEATFAAELAKQGLSLDDFKGRYRKEIEEQLYVSRFMRQELAAIEVSETDLRHFFDTKYDSIPRLPEVVGIAHIMITPKISEAKENEIHGRVSSALGRIRAGEPFDKVARDVSDDQLTRAAGGDIGLVALADLQDEIAGVAAKLAPGQVSEPVRTPHGIEIVKLEERSGEQYRLRHIFMRFAPGLEDTLRASGLAEDLRARLAGGEDFEALARQYSDDATTKEKGGYLGEVEVSALEQFYRDALVSLNPGEISPVIRTPAGYQILKLVSRTVARGADYDEAKSWIRNVIETRRREAKFDVWLETARQEIYVKKM